MQILGNIFYAMIFVSVIGSIFTVFSLLDTYPSAGNLARLEFLKEPTYFVYRTILKFLCS